MLSKSALLLPISGIKPTHWITVDSDDTRGVRASKVASSRGIMRAPEATTHYEYGFNARLAKSALTPQSLGQWDITGLWTYLAWGTNQNIVYVTNYLELYYDSGGPVYDRGTYEVCITRLDTKRQITVSSGGLSTWGTTTFTNEVNSTDGSEEGRFFTLADKGKTIPLDISGIKFLG